jgi:hypothetical protein
MIVRPRAHAGERRHDDPVGQIEAAHAMRREQ